MFHITCIWVEIYFYFSHLIFILLLFSPVACLFSAYGLDLSLRVAPTVFIRTQAHCYIDISIAFSNPTVTSCPKIPTHQSVKPFNRMFKVFLKPNEKTVWVSFNMNFETD